MRIRSEAAYLMGAFAAVTTGKGIGAIAVVQVFGDSAEDIIKKIFRPVSKKPTDFEPGRILLGTINDGAEIIDYVIIACEGPGLFAINCHGNPLIVADIMQLLQNSGAILLSSEEFLTKFFSAANPPNTIAIEAKLTILHVKTIEGTKIIANQVNAGLTKKIEEWLHNEIPLEKIKTDAEQILSDSKVAKLIIFGCKIALIGPPNTGKSTLLNYLTGRQKTIVTDIAGTTRDWVSAQCRISPLFVEFIDTAGLAETRTGNIEKASQQKSVEMLEKADLILLVLDNSRPNDQLDENVLKKIAGRKILTVLNKSDLPAKFDACQLPENIAETVKISAKLGTGIEELLKKIQYLCGVTGFNLKTAVSFTPRQEILLKQLQKADSNRHAVSTITELLNGRVSV